MEKSNYIKAQLDYVKAQLERRKSQLTKVAVESDTSLRTLYYIIEGKIVRKSTLTRVHDYLKANSRKREL